MGNIWLRYFPIKLYHIFLCIVIYSYL